MWNIGFNVPTEFVSQYVCSSTTMAGKDIQEGDKIFLPPSALDKLARMNVEYPMLFEITNESLKRKTHCGVLEFSADEGWCYLPYWMMKNLLLEERGLITVKNVSLNKATFVKFRATSVDFLEVSNPRAVLEVALRKFTCLTEGDIIQIPYADKLFELEVREVQPNGAASIIETDCNVDFEEPIGYKDSKYAQHERERNSRDSSAGSIVKQPRTLQKARLTPDENSQSKSGFTAFSGFAKRIDGKVLNKSTPQSKNEEKRQESQDKPLDTSNSKPAIPVYQSRIGDKYSKKKTAVSAFTGTAHKLNG